MLMILIQTVSNGPRENGLNGFPEQLLLDSANLPCNKLKMLRTIV